MPDVPADGAHTLRAQNAGVPLDATTLRPSWGGDRLDLG
jgi:hypothetical protein